MYQKLFPDRMIEINDYFSSSKKLDEEKSRYTEELNLPKVHGRTNSIRNRIALKNGKLNISFS